MASKQEIIDKITLTADEVDSIIEHFKDIADFCKADRTKKEIMDFCENMLLEKVLTSTEIKNLYFKLSLHKSYGNVSKLKTAIRESEKVKYLNDNFKLRQLSILKDIKEHIFKVHKEIEDLPYDNIQERLIALRKSVSKLYRLPNDSNVLFNIDNFVTMEVDTSNYLTESLEILLDEVDGKWKCGDVINWDLSGNDYSWNYGNNTNLRNLIVYLNYIDTFLKY